MDFAPTKCTKFLWTLLALRNIVRLKTTVKYIVYSTTENRKDQTCLKIFLAVMDSETTTNQHLHISTINCMNLYIFLKYFFQLIANWSGPNKRKSTWLSFSLAVLQSDTNDWAWNKDMYQIWSQYLKEFGHIIWKQRNHMAPIWKPY